MKFSYRTFAFFVIALIASGIFAVTAPFAHAQSVGTGLTPPSSASPSTLLQTPTIPSIGNTTPPQSTNPAASPGAAGATSNSLSLADPSDWLPWIFAQIASLFAWLLGVAALVLDTAVYYTIANMGQFVNMNGNQASVAVAWGILRNIGNIALIFGFIATGIAIILDVDIYGSRTKMIPRLILAALLLNFSLLISEGIIDIGNLFATEIYAQINGGSLPTPSQFSSGAPVVNEGISNSVMQALGIQNLYDTAGTANNTSNNSIAATQAFVSHSLLANFLACILFLVATFVFLSLAFVVVARFVILIFLIIVAPIGFVGLAIPQLSSVAGRWWNMLVKQTITAPVLMLLLYIALAIITGAGFVTSLSGSVGGLGGLFGSYTQQSIMSGISVVLVYIVAMGLLLVVVVVTKSLSAFGGSWATKMGGKLSFGALAYGMSSISNATGYGGRRLAQLGATSNRAWLRAASRASTRYAFRPMENARLDVRRLPGVSAGLKTASAGEAAEAIRESPRGRIRQVQEHFRNSSQEEARQYSAETILPRLQAETNEALAMGDYRQVGAILASMNNRDLDTARFARALIANPTAAALLPNNRYERLQQSENLSDQLKTDLATARRNGDDPSNTNSRYNMDPAILHAANLPNGQPNPRAGMMRGQAIVRNMTSSERARLPGNVLTEVPAGAPPGTPPDPRDSILNLLDPRDLDSIRTTSRSGDARLTQEQIEAIGRYIKAVHTAAPAAGYAAGSREARIAALAAGSPAFRTFYNLP